MKSILLILFVILGFSGMSQVELKAEDFSSDWTLLTEQNGVKMYIQKGECQMGNVKEAFTYGFLKIENTSSDSKTVTFNFNLYYTDGCAGCDNPNEEYSSIEVAPNSSVKTDCSFENSQLALLVRNPLQTEYTEFKYLSLIDLKVD